MKRRKKKLRGPPPSKWWRVVWAVLPAVVLVVGTEGALRLAGFGYPTTFFIPSGNGFVDSNERYAWRFMSPELARNPQPIHFAAGKAAGTERIFVFGESAAFGVPDPAFSFSRILDVMLRDRHPGTPFEVINTGMTAINSHAIREIALESLNYEPDLLVIYCGNNEVVGPFGPGTVFQSGSPGLGFIRFQLWLSRTAIWQGLMRLTDFVAGERSIPRQWNGMEMFTEHKVGPDDPRLGKVVAHFRTNLGDILDAARRRGVPVVICTVPVNLEDCPPFASVHQRGLSIADEGRWQGFYASGTNAEAHGDWATAEKSYAAAQAVDPDYAEVDYRRGRCLTVLGRFNESEQAYSEARDHDALRFRTDSRLDAMIRELARDGGPGVTLYDAAADFAHGHSALFYEHVHMTFEGNYRLALGFLPKVEAALALDTVETKTPAAPSMDRCEQELAYTDWSRWKSDKAALEMMARPPFSLQLDHDRTFADKFHALDEAGRAVSSPEALERNVKAYDAVLNERPDDALLREDLLQLLDQQGDVEREVREAQTLMATPPLRAQSKLLYGDALLHAGRVPEAIQVYREVIRLRPEEADPRQALGDALGETGADGEALAAYEAAAARGDDRPEFHNNFAMMLINKGDLARAEEQLERALYWSQNPLWEANLAGILFKQGKYNEALQEYQKALAGMPDSPDLRDNLGLTLAALGRKGEAAGQFREALRISPGDGRAWQQLQQLQGQP